MRRPLFKNKISRFGSLISLILITAMLALFSLALPGFLVSTTGRVFAVVWALIAIAVFIAHIHRMKPERRPKLLFPYLDGGRKKDARGIRQEKRYMRGL